MLTPHLSRDTDKNYSLKLTHDQLMAVWNALAAHQQNLEQYTEEAPEDTDSWRQFVALSEVCDELDEAKSLVLF